ncbi:MAG: hypothetical protein HY365_02455 [Candidatus Aenigmarchaeota archaeon]|nr:hypothetical protein [Candidatus Aenigmarchaeota archaeon]
MTMKRAFLREAERIAYEKTGVPGLSESDIGRYMNYIRVEAGRAFGHDEVYIGRFLERIGTEEVSDALARLDARQGTRSSGVIHLTYGGMPLVEYLLLHYFPSCNSLTVRDIVRELGFKPSDYGRVAGAVKSAAEELGWEKTGRGPGKVTYAKPGI